MDTFTITIIMILVIGAIVFFIATLYKNTFGNKKPQLSYNERVFLQANLDLELDKDDLSDRHIRAGGREKKKDFKVRLKI